LIELNQGPQLDLFLRENPDLANSKLCNNSTNTICRATYLGYMDCVILLVKHGVDVNHCSQGGRSPLMWAAYRNHTHIIDYLLENGADTTIRDETGLNAFEMAVTLVNYEAALLLRTKAGMDTPPEERKMYVEKGGEVIGNLYR
jgi:ankyrin repeat protein